MPYFSWQGITITGTVQTGKRAAPTKEILEELLLSQGYALLHCREVRSIFKWRIKDREVIQFFYDLSDLLASGVILPDALLQCATRAQSMPLQESLYQVFLAVQQGTSFADAMRTKSGFTSPLIFAVLEAGEHASDLFAACQLMAAHKERMFEFRSKLRTVLFMPLVTLSVFCAALVLIVGYMVPQFEALLQTFGTSKTKFSSRFISIIKLLFSWQSGITIFALGLFFSGFLVCAQKNGRVRALMQSGFLKLPFIRHILVFLTLGNLFFSLSVLLKSGVRMADALAIVAKLSTDTVLALPMQNITSRVLSGAMLSALFKEYIPNEYDLSTSARLAVAETTGKMPEVCQKTSDAYFAQASHILHRLLRIVPPVTIVLLGMLVFCLLVALYAPLMELSLSLS